MSINNYDEATWDQILRVMRAADALQRVGVHDGMASIEHQKELHDALAACPGTAAWHAKLVASQGATDCGSIEKPQLDGKSFT